MNKLLIALIVGCLALLLSNTVHSATLYRNPLNGNVGINSWFDLDSRAGYLKRYDCITNFSRDEHHGIDFSAALGTQIYAGARGSLYYRYDNCPDYGSMTDTCGGSFGNHVRIEHPDAFVTIYAHMQRGTPAWPQSLQCSAQVGKVASSGQSSGTHLHFELWRNRNIGAREDFFWGACTYTGYWVNQNYGIPTTQCQ